MQAQLRVLGLHGVFGAAVPTLSTVQDAAAVTRVDYEPPDRFAATLRRVLAERRFDVLVLGALGAVANVRRLADELQRADAPVVLDPIMGSTSGAALLQGGGLDALRALLPRVAVLTPNLPEARVLVGQGSAEQLAERLLALGPRAVVLKGGHATGGADDLYVTGDGARWLRAERIPGPPAHGTGCLFSASLGAALALGSSLDEAVDHAKRCVTEGIRQGRALAREGEVGPVWLGELP